MEKRAILAAMLMAGLLMVYQTFFLIAGESPPSRQGRDARDARTRVQRQAATPGERSGGARAEPTASPRLRPGPRRGSRPWPRRRCRSAWRRWTARSTARPVEQSRREIRGVGAQLPGSEAHGRSRPDRPDGPRPSSGRAARPRSCGFTLAAERRWCSGRSSPQGEITLVGDDGFGLRISETLRFRADGYDVERVIRVENRHAVAQSAEIVLGWSAPVEWPKDQREKFQGQHPTRVVRALADGLQRARISRTRDARRRRAMDRARERVVPVRVRAQGARASSWPRPRSNGAASVAVRATLPALAARPDLGGHGAALCRAQGVRPAQGTRESGSRSRSISAGFPCPSTTAACRWNGSTVPILWLPAAGSTRSPRNYGVAIILLTVITKVLFFPLTVKSMRSMKAMQAMQPQVNALRSKHKSDAAKLQQETMELYREHGVNPLGGCLPMVVQIPVFYALYVALSVAVEMQNAPFICFGRAPSWLPCSVARICGSAISPTRIRPTSCRC